MGTSQPKITYDKKDLEVLFDDKLLFDSHILAKINKANWLCDGFQYQVY